MNIKAIETVYNGYRFRSRLEARWAVFFDTLGIKYEYEKEGFDLDGTWYLPDFWLPEQKCWIEIKGEMPTEDERKKAILLAQHSQHMVYIFHGTDFRQFQEASYVSDFGGMQAIGFHPDCPSYSAPFVFIQCPECLKVGIWHYFSFSDVPCPNGDHYLLPYTPGIGNAYTAARQARFEFGENGR